MARKAERWPRLVLLPIAIIRGTSIRPFLVWYLHTRASIVAVLLADDIATVQSRGGKEASRDNAWPAPRYNLPVRLSLPFGLGCQTSSGDRLQTATVLEIKGPPLFFGCFPLSEKRRMLRSIFKVL